MRKTITAALIVTGSLALTACGSAEEPVPNFTEETSTSTSTTTVQAMQPPEWETLSDMAETVHTATENCPRLLVEESGVGGCGDGSASYMMALNVFGYSTASEKHKLSIASQSRDDHEVMLWGDGWSINCWGEDSVSSCGDIYDLIPSATWVDMEPSEGFDLTTSPAEPKNGFSDGTHLVGVDIDPATYRTDGGEGCYWERQSGLSGTSADRITNDFSRERKQTYVTIDPSDVAFESKRCGTWELVE